MSFMRVFFLLCLGFLCPGLMPPAPAQDAPPLARSQIASEIQPLAHKMVILVFDVTESTRHGGIFAQERAAAATILHKGCAPGDRVILMKFGTGYETVFDKTLTQPSDTDTLVNLVPAAPEPGHGTNIRWPHHEALKLIEKDSLCPAVVILLTDSFNDRPDLTDPNYSKYLAYYTLKGLTVYPDTPENRDYERLLRTLTRKGCLHEYGVGVGIAADERPIERLPVGPGQGDSDTGGAETPTVLAPSGEKSRASLLPWILGLLALLLLTALWFFLRNRPLPLRLRLGDKGLPRDFRLPPGSQIALGGAPGAAAGSLDIFPLAGMPLPAAFVQHGRGGLTLAPASADPNGLFHNGLALQQPSPLRVGDEVRIVVPATEADPAREHRLRVEDPRGPVF